MQDTSASAALAVICIWFIFIQTMIKRQIDQYLLKYSITNLYYNHKCV